MMTDSLPLSKNRPLFSRQFWMRAISVVITLALVAYLLTKIEWETFLHMMQGVPFIAFVGSFAAYFALNFFRALRFRALLETGSHIRLRVLFPITLYHNFLVRVLPFKLGELSYIVLMRTHLNYSVQEGVSSLVGARLFELLIIVMGGVAGLAFSGGHFDEQRDLIVFVVVIGFALCILGLYFAGTLIRWLVASGRYLVRLFMTTVPNIYLQIADKLEKLAREFDRLRQPRFFSAGVFYSIFTYGASFIANQVLLQAVGVDVPFPILVAIVSIGMFSSAFPFAISGFGVVEASWAFALVYLAGYDMGQATSIGFLLHGYQIVCASITGLIGYLLLARIPESFPQADTTVIRPPSE